MAFSKCRNFVIQDYFRPKNHKNVQSDSFLWPEFMIG